MVFPGFAGSGKTTAASVMVNAMLANPSIKRVYVSASTNAAVSHICQRINQIRVELINDLDHTNRILRLCQAIVLRGYQLEIEEDQVMQRLRAPRNEHRSGLAGNIWHPSSWTLENSLAFFTLQALGFVSDEIPELSDKGSPPLVALRDSIATSGQYAGLWSLASGTMTYEEYQAGQECSKSDFRDLQCKVASCASVICSTPETSANTFFEPLKRTSDVIVLSAAGAMCRADAINVWGNACRPCIIVGDWRQMEPAILSAKDTFGLGDNCFQKTGETVIPRNRFAKDGQASVLEHVMRIGHPVCNLDHQYRMAIGQFDLALKVVYGEVSKTYTYDDSTRYNEEQNGFALNLFRGLCGAGIPEQAIKVVTTYGENRRHLENLFREAFANVACHTVDSFNGGISRIVILVLCVNRASGPCFMKDPRRLAVSITRHTDHLLVIGDIHTMSSYDGIVGKDDDSDYEERRNGPLARMLSWFSKKRRVVIIDDAARGDDPRNTVKTYRTFQKGVGWVIPDNSSNSRREDKGSTSAPNSEGRP
ncbi:DNA helicase [Purpureocillium takamizusanense]|uniref:DNA helicase n=1 Tax=Purpureocillium takamizusanense TaxID=2060973 RepID=A0A9Q8VC35_9HYPO|nr:DNA helicase [Purpureocillium takamizusanense]UNI19581.1 DNA helicase [Purpureocillium takamizusanense]